MKAQTGYRVVGREEVLSGRVDQHELAAALAKDERVADAHPRTGDAGASRGG
ncbi:MAG: hypothetical protein IT437_13050 [Phycisphaerales bacterium]|nr:hypothetical protein [Phycisphaerales bacterium]